MKFCLRKDKFRRYAFILKQTKNNNNNNNSFIHSFDKYTWEDLFIKNPYSNYSSFTIYFFFLINLGKYLIFVVHKVWGKDKKFTH